MSPNADPPNTIPDSHRDLLSAEFATLATLGADGFPQLSEVWFLADTYPVGPVEDGPVVRMSLNTSRQKTRNLQRDAHCCVFILDAANPYRYLEIRGVAELDPDDDYEFADRLGAKYGSDLRVHDQPGDKRVVVTIRPERVNAVKMRD
jgi:PPOX class probable F420-dependent enzyme